MISRRFRVGFFLPLCSPADSTSDDFKIMMPYPDSDTQASSEALAPDENEMPRMKRAGYCSRIHFTSDHSLISKFLFVAIELVLVASAESELILRRGT